MHERPSHGNTMSRRWSVVLIANQGNVDNPQMTWPRAFRSSTTKDIPELSSMVHVRRVNWTCNMELTSNQVAISQEYGTWCVRVTGEKHPSEALAR